MSEEPVVCEIEYVSRRICHGKGIDPDTVVFREPCRRIDSEWSTTHGQQNHPYWVTQQLMAHLAVEAVDEYRSADRQQEISELNELRKLKQRLSALGILGLISTEYAEEEVFKDRSKARQTLLEMAQRSRSFDDLQILRGAVLEFLR